MGTDDGLNRKSNYEIQFSKGKMIKDESWGNYFEYTNFKNNTKIICKEKIINNRQELLKTIEESKRKILNKNENLLNILDYSVEVQKNWCSTFYLLKLFYENPNKNLKDETTLRKSINKNYDMKELTHFFYNMISVGCHFQTNNINNIDICPANIYMITKENFKFLISERNVNPERYQLDKMLRNEDYYLSPKLYVALKNRYLDNIKHNPIKSDIFAFGLVLLELGIMKSIKPIYDTSSINKKILESFLKEFEERYQNNPLLYSSLRKILDINEEDRIDFLSLKEVIPDYEMIKEYFQKLENGELEEDDEEDEIPKDIYKNNTNHNIYESSNNQYNNYQNTNKFENKKENKVNQNNLYDKNLNRNYPSERDLKYNNVNKNQTNKIENSQNNNFVNFFDVLDEKPKNSFEGKKTDADIYSQNNLNPKNSSNEFENFFDQNSFIPPLPTKTPPTNLYSNLNQKNTDIIQNKDNYSIYNKTYFDKNPSNHYSNNYFESKETTKSYFSNYQNTNRNVNYLYNQPKTINGYNNQEIRTNSLNSNYMNNGRPISMNNNYSNYGRPISQKTHTISVQRENNFKRPESSYQKTLNTYYPNSNQQSGYSKYK
jgi:hypothetical protein